MGLTQKRLRAIVAIRDALEKVPYPKQLHHALCVRDVRVRE